MKKAILSIGVLFVSCAAMAQTDCPFYETYLQKGKDELQKGEKADFKKAIEALLKKAAFSQRKMRSIKRLCDRAHFHFNVELQGNH
jgi:hypothetical protein